MVTAESVRDEITVERVKREIEKGWINPFVIA